jgi:two-component system, NtrC family, response regulator HydG
MRVLLQWVGKNDFKDDAANPKGPTLQLLNDSEYRERFDRAFLMSNAETRPIAEGLVKELEASGRERPVAEAVLLEVSDPTDYGVLYREMSSACRRIQDGLMGESADYTIHISPGTPQASAVWLLMALGGDIEAEEVLQTIRPDYQREGLAVRPVNLSIDVFPRVERLERENRDLRAALGKAVSFGKIKTRSRAMAEIFERLRAAASYSTNVLLTGETGTGKNFWASAIHNHSDRNSKPFIPVHCAGMPENLIESELFGHVKGAFTGANRDREGRFEAADGGTIFLDEIGDMKPEMQMRLLRVLQDGSYQRVGENKERKSQARVIAATNADLMARVASGEFREDLYYRLTGGVVIELPPLRDRLEDLEFLCSGILKLLENEGLPSIPPLDDKALDELRRYDWPGNIRELEKVLRKVMMDSKGKPVTPTLVRQAVSEARKNALHVKKRASSSESLEDVEREHILNVLNACGDNKTEAAKRLGISRNTLDNKLKTYKSTQAE